MLTWTQYQRWGSETPLADIVAPNLLAFGIGCVFGLGISWLESTVARLRSLNSALTETRADLAAEQHQLGIATERERMSREIHDTLAQGLVSIVVLAQTAQAELGEHHPARASVDRIAAAAREDLTAARRLLEDGVVSAIEEVSAMLDLAIDRFEADTAIPVARDLQLGDTSGELGVALLRCLQESLANVRRHAGATSVQVSAAREAGAIVLRVLDDGCGIGDAGEGFGLRGLRARAAEVGGDAVVCERPEGGTCVAVRIPDAGSGQPSPAEPDANLVRFAPAAPTSPTELDLVGSAEGAGS